MYYIYNVLIFMKEKEIVHRTFTKITKIYEKNCMLYVNLIYTSKKRTYISTNI